MERRLPRTPEFDGPRFAIHALTLADGTCPAGDFLDALDPRDRRKLDVLFERFGNAGKISNVEKFKKIEGSEEIWEFKSFQIRILCFFAPRRRVILAFGLRKKKNKHKPKDIDRAEAYREWFLASEGSGPQ